MRQEVFPTISDKRQARGQLITTYLIPRNHHRHSNSLSRVISTSTGFVEEGMLVGSVGGALGGGRTFALVRVMLILFVVSILVLVVVPGITGAGGDIRAGNASTLTIIIRARTSVCRLSAKARTTGFTRLGTNNCLDSGRIARTATGLSVTNNGISVVR